MPSRPVEIDAGARRLLDAVLAADQHGGAEPLVDEGQRGADDLLLLALGEDDALGLAAHALEDALQRPAIGIAPRRTAAPVGGMSTIGLRATPLSIAALATATGTPWIRRGSNGTGMMYSGPKRGRVALIGGGDLVRHVLAGELGQRLGGGDLHFHR
jgi:hypothetical protein